jgi:hypothetical protein
LKRRTLILKQANTVGEVSRDFGTTVGAKRAC